MDKFLEEHKMKHSEVEEFRWRGHGCPGACPYARGSDGREAAYDYVDFWFENGKASGPLTYQWRCKMCSDFLGLSPLKFCGGKAFGQLSKGPEMGRKAGTRDENR